MIKRTPSRNQRTKGIRAKRVLKICLLLGVCFWLIYQVKHSHDKKAALDVKNAKTSIKNLSDGEVLKLGRKDLPQKEVTKNEKREEDEEEEAAGEEEEEEEKHEVEARGEEDQKHEVEEREEEDPKHEVGEQEEEDQKHEGEEQEEEENRNEDAEDEGRRAGDDEIDENEEERKEGEADHDEEFVDEEKEREDEGNESEEREDQAENENSLDDQDTDTHDKNAHEATEENYKGDDASSAVTHDTQVSLENTNENSEASTLVKEIKSSDRSRMVDNGMAENGTSLNVSESEEKVNDKMSNAVESSLLNATVKTESDDLPEAGNNSTVVSAEANNNSTTVNSEASNNSTEINEATDSYQQNRTETISELVRSQNATVDGTTTGEGMTIQTLVVGKTNNTDSQNNQSDSNSTISTKIENADGASGESSNSSNKLKTNVSGKILISDGTADFKNGSTSPTVKEITDASQKEEPNGTSESGRTDEVSDSTNVTEDVRNDPIDLSDSHISEDEKEARTDLYIVRDKN